jgi:hypothetical protein
MSRPEKPIDWKKVDDLLMAGCFGTEIASHFDMHPNTFYDRVNAQYNMSFTDYSCQKRQKGDSLIRTKQFEKALKGDNVMLVWLGKNRLNQRESAQNDNIDAEILSKYTVMMEQIRKLQDSERNVASINSNAEQKS